MLRSNIVPILAVLAVVNAPTCLGQLGVTRQLFVMGGRSDYNPETYPAFVEAAGGQGVARIGIVSAASGTPVQSGHAYEVRTKSTHIFVGFIN